jgi:8-oxo-dGTP pyrophosphatase MutT (NUDIX family)
VSQPGDAGHAPPWQILARETLADYEVFTVERLRARSPRTGVVFDRYALHLPDWINVVAFTEDGLLLMVEQYRFGAGVLSLEFPAGLLDPGEDPLDGALRELREETGYEPATLRLAGSVCADPAIQDNRLHVALALGCRRAGAPKLDEGEDVHLRLVGVAALEGMIERGEIRHALAIAAWHLAGPALADP